MACVILVCIVCSDTTVDKCIKQWDTKLTKEEIYFLLKFSLSHLAIGSRKISSFIRVYQKSELKIKL